MSTIGRNAVDRVPSRAKWPPPWLNERVSADIEPADAVVLPAIIPATTQAAAESMPETTAWDPGIPVEDIAPCPTCGSLELWWDGMENQHCMRCQPPRLNCDQLIARAARLRANAERRKARSVLDDSLESSPQKAGSK